MACMKRFPILAPNLADGSAYRRDVWFLLNPATLVTLTLYNTGANLSHKEKPVRHFRELESTTNQNIEIKHEPNNSLHRWMRLRRDPLPIDGHTGCDASLSLSRLPASQWRAVFGFRYRAYGSF